MYKVIFNSQGGILAGCNPDQDLERLKSNWSDCLHIEVEQLPDIEKWWLYWVNPVTLMLEIKP
jgi:hypothetical protein